MTPYSRPGIKQPFEFSIAKPVDKIMRIAEMTCRVCNIELDKLLSRSRKREYVQARQIVCFLCNKYMKIKLMDLGEFFGKDHSTIIHSRDNITNLLDIKDTEVVDIISEVRKRCLIW